MPVLVLAAVLVGGVGVFAAVRAGEGAVDDAREILEESGDAFGGRRVPGGALALDGAAVPHTIDDREVGSHPLDGIAGRITIAVAGDDGFDPVLRVLGADGRALGEDDDGGDGRGSRLAVTLPGGVGAVALVRDFGGDAGSYTVTVHQGDDVAGIAPVAGVALVSGVEVDGTIGAQGSVAHSFTGLGRPVTITVRGIDGFDPVLVVRAGDDVLGRNDDADGTDSRLELTLAEGQQVVVEVSGFAGRAGSYRVLIA